MANETMKYDRNVVEDLLRSAKEHFLLHGYEKASLRKICAGAGVTTGALYFSFENKEALFDALVHPTLVRVEDILRDVHDKLVNNNGAGFDADGFNDFIFQFLADNRDGIRLLMARSDGSQYENFHDRIYGHVENLMKYYANRLGGTNVNPEVIRILTHMYFTAISDLIANDYSQEEMLNISKSLRACMETGFYAMVHEEQA